MLRLTASILLPLLLASCECGSNQPAGEERRTIAVIPKGTTHIFWRAVHAGALTAANDEGVDIVWQGPVREDDRGAQIRVVEDMIARGVDAIVLAPLDDTALVPVATEATNEGIPVVIFDSGIEWDGYASFVATDNHRGGEIAAERLGQLLNGAGRVIVMRYQEGSASTTERERGFLEAMARQFPRIEIASSEQYAGATMETAYQTAENLLVRFPEIDGIFTPNESTTFGMLRALRDANRAGQVKFVGFDSNEQLAQALRTGHVHGLVLQNPSRMGELGVRTAVARIEGREVERRIDTGATMVTADNADAMQNLLTPDLSVLSE